MACNDPLPLEEPTSENPYVRNLEVNPDTIRFELSDGQKDTLLTISLQVDGYNFEVDSVPNYLVFSSDNEEAILTGSFPANFSPITQFSTSINIPTNTIDFDEYTVIVFPKRISENASYALATLPQIGVPVNAPKILFVDNPNQVVIPSESNTTTVKFIAKVEDLDGQSNIDHVYLNFRNEDGSLLSATPFDLLDDGGSTSGDETAADSVYTRTFIIDSSNTPNNRTALYWAIDKAGLSSDTLTAPFNIISN